MSRVWADRIVRTLLALLAASVLWIVVYEVAVGARYNKNDPTEGASRWALIRAQFADRDFSTFGWKTVLLGPNHFWARVQYPATQEEALKRGGFALAFVGAAGLALAIALKVNGPAKHKGDAQFGSLLDAAKTPPDRAARPHSRQDERNRHSQRGPGAYPDDRAESVGQGLRLHRAEWL